MVINKKQKYNRSLKIQYETLDFTEHRLIDYTQRIEFSCLIGIKFIKNIPILLLGIEDTLLLHLGTTRVNQIKKIKFLPITPQKDHQSILSQLASQLQVIQAIFQAGFHYYSQDYDLSLPFLLNRLYSPRPQQRIYYDQFIWNHNLATVDGQKSSMDARLFWNWCDKIIQGYVCEYSCDLPQQKIRYIVITRRSFKKAGTRFYARGIDDEGHVANFAQTQQIIYLGQYIFTHLQIRGRYSYIYYSVPAFFAQVGVNGIASDMVIQRSPALTRQAFLTHFNTLKTIYSRIFAINLLTQKKTDELMLSNFYQQMVSKQANQLPFLRYQFYDFHEECKNNKFQNSEKLLQQISQIFDVFGYNCYQTTTKTIIKYQKGVFRTNCLDCLDRTNYLQSRIALRVCKHFLQRFSNQKIHSLITQKMLLDLPINQKYPLLGGFNASWADNGDAISLLYTGIGSTHTDITRTGERTFFGAINHKLRSLMRFYVQFNDHVKHEAIMKIVTPTPQNRLKNMKRNFHTTLIISIDNQTPLEDALDEIRQRIVKVKPTTIEVLVFQKKEETFFDKLTCVINNTTKDFKKWQHGVIQTVQTQRYEKVGVIQGKRTWMGVFCQQKMIHLIGDVKKQNLSEELSDGQALLLKMKLQYSSFIFAGINCKTFQQFLTMFDQLHHKGFQIRRLGLYKSQSFLDLDYKIVFGNTGSEIKMDNQQLRRLQSNFMLEYQQKNVKQTNKIINKVLDHDQLSIQEHRWKNKYIRQYAEGPIQFIPSSNRILFWNQDRVVLRVRQYSNFDKNSIVGVLDYQIGQNCRQSIHFNN